MPSIQTIINVHKKPTVWLKCHTYDFALSADYKFLFMHRQVENGWHNKMSAKAKRQDDPIYIKSTFIIKQQTRQKSYIVVQQVYVGHTQIVLQVLSLRPTKFTVQSGDHLGWM